MTRRRQFGPNSEGLDVISRACRCPWDHRHDAAVVGVGGWRHRLYLPGAAASPFPKEEATNACSLTSNDTRSSYGPYDA